MPRQRKSEGAHRRRLDNSSMSASAAEHSLSSALGRAVWPALYACAILLAILREGHCMARETLCMDEYWLEFWLAQGSPFQARGLTSAVTRFLWPDSANIVTLNVLAMGVCVAITIACVAMLHRASTSPWARAGIVILCASPLISVIFEVLGDPLEIAVLLFAGAVFALTRIGNFAVRVALVLAVSVIAVLIHEASIFLLMPAFVLLLVAKGRPTFWTYAAAAALGAALVAPILLDTRTLAVDPGYHAYNPLRGTLIWHVADPFEPYGDHLQKEIARIFASLRGLADFVLKFPRTWFIPLLGLALVSMLVFKGERARLLWRDWIFLTICSLPLYGIAHDWSRFSAVTFWAAMLTSLCRAHAEQQPTEADRLDRLAPANAPSAPVVFAVLGSLILAAEAVNADYRWQGMPLISLVLIFPAAIAYVAWQVWSRSRG